MPRLSQLLTPPDSPLPAPSTWQCEHAVLLLRNVLRLTAPNAGAMTGPGTNSYLVGDVRSGFVVIDPGPPDAAHVQRLWAAAAFADGSGGNIRYIVCTHSHADHAPAAAPLQALCASRPPHHGPAIGHYGPRQQPLHARPCTTK